MVVNEENRWLEDLHVPGTGIELYFVTKDSDVVSQIFEVSGNRIDHISHNI